MAEAETEEETSLQNDLENLLNRAELDMEQHGATHAATISSPSSAKYAISAGATLDEPVLTTLLRDVKLIGCTSSAMIHTCS